MDSPKLNLSDAKKTLIGVVLIKLSTGIISTWGSINLYLLSYFHQQGESVSSSTNSLLLLGIVVPTSLIILIAPAISNRIGYELTIKLCGWIFLVSPQLLIMKTTVLTTWIFGLLIPCSCFAVSTIPLFNCMWTQFPQHRNKVTSVAVTCFSLGGILWNTLFTILVNPNNLKTTIEEEGMQFFSEDVSNLVIPVFRGLFVISGIMFVTGSYYIKRGSEEPIIEDAQKLVEVNEIKEYEEYEILDRLSGGAFSVRKSEQLLPDETVVYLSQALKNWKFIFVFLISLFSGLYQIFIMMNVKIIYMPIVQDDYFIVECLVVSTVISIGGAFFWGYLGDKYGFFSTLFAFTFIDLVIKVFGCFSVSKLGILLLFCGIGLVDKAMLTIMGPGLVEIFGIKLAT